MKRILSILLCIILLLGMTGIPSSAAIFQISYYTEDVYAGGIIDMYVFPKGGVEPYTYQWQVDLGIGDGNWSNLEENANYKGTKTNHLQLCTSVGNYGDWGNIPFACVVTDAEGTTFYSPNIFGEIYPTGDLIPKMEKWGYELYEPTLSNVSGLSTSDYESYTANTYAGNKLDIFCGSKPIEHAILNNSEVSLTREIHITENGHTTKVGDQTTYIPYTIGTNAVTVEIKLRLRIRDTDLGDLDTKTVKLNVQKPTVVSTTTAKSDCSLLRYTYNESQKLASIPKGASVEIICKEGSYYQVLYNNLVGYVGASLLNVQQSSSYDPVIRDVNVTIAEPVVGQKPALTCNVLTQSCELYKTDPVTWIDQETNRFMGANDTFQKGHSYVLTIWLAAKSGYKFQVDASDQPKLTGTINGNLPPFIHKAYEQDPEKVIELTYTFHNVQNAPTHTCKPVLVNGVEPTCTENGKQPYYHCECGKNYQDMAATQVVDISSWGVIPALGHSADASWKYNGTHHYQKCICCNIVIPGTNAPHAGGTATCREKAKCDTCGFAYGQLGDHELIMDSWTYQEDAGHAHGCQSPGCNAHGTLYPHTPGPAATVSSPQLCADCGYIMQPSGNHVHNLTKVPRVAATCTTPGTIEYYTCSGCSDRFADAAGTNKIETTVEIPPLGHVTSDFWKADTETHWRICTLCQEVLEETNMHHTDDNQDEKCDTCLCDMQTGKLPENPTEVETQPEEPAKPTEAEDSQAEEKAPKDKKDSDEKTSNWHIWVLVFLTVFAASVITTIILFKRKKGESK